MKEIMKWLMNMRTIMAYRVQIVCALAILVGASLIYSSFKAESIYTELKDISKEQKEMMEFLETWKKCV